MHLKESNATMLSLPPEHWVSFDFQGHQPGLPRFA